jgi:hypothetical protein
MAPGPSNVTPEMPPINTSSSNVQPSPQPSRGNADPRGRYSNPRRANLQMILKPPRFEGRCEELKASVYDSVDARQVEQYTRTTKEIAEFIGRTYKYGMDTRLSIENMAVATFAMPEDPPDNASKTELRVWEKTVDDYVTRTTALKENLKSAYSLIWGQCSDIMRQKLRPVPHLKQSHKLGMQLHY